MNKAVLILAIFALCLTPALSSNMRGSEDRELKSIPLGNLGDIIGGIIGAIKNSTNNNNNSTSPSTPPANNTNNNTSPSNSTNNNTSPSNSTDNSTSPTTPPTNNTTNNTSPSNSTNNSTSPSTPPANNSTNNDTTPITPPVTPPANPNWYAKNDVDMSAFKDKCLVIHNILRQAVGVPDLTWSDSLAASAQAWADNMAVNGFRHSGKTGENIASTTYSTKVLIRLLGLWTKEQDWYIKGCKYPKCSSNGKEVGHYTQMVWSKTTQVGCGFAAGVNRGWNYLCCQYYKAGNIIGQTVYPYTAPTN